ncbi:MAG TPA: hypothetical protein VK842_06770 [bacterium]|nr:hypothetical protein [bacterium]
MAIDRGYAVPNPNPGAAYFHLIGDVDDVQLRLYTKAMVCFWQADSGPRKAGWGRINLDGRALALAGDGVGYMALTPFGHGAAGRRVLLPFLVLR